MKSDGSSASGGQKTSAAFGSSSSSVRDDHCLHLRALLADVLQEADAEGDVAVLVLLDQAEALVEARVEVVVRGVLDDDPLARHRQHPLGDHVVGDDALDEELEVVGLVLDPVGDLAQRVVEEEVPRTEHPVLDLVQPLAEVAGLEPHHLGHPAVEEDGVAHLVDELGREEGLDLPARRGEQERRQVGGDPLLADVEAAEAEGGVRLRLAGVASQCSRSTEKSSSCARQFWRSQSA